MRSARSLLLCVLLVGVGAAPRRAHRGASDKVDAYALVIGDQLS